MLSAGARPKQEFSLVQHNISSPDRQHSAVQIPNDMCGRQPVSQPLLVGPPLLPTELKPQRISMMQTATDSTLKPRVGARRFPVRYASGIAFLSRSVALRGTAPQ